MMKSILAAIVPATAALAAVPAAAADQEERTPTATISFADLDLAREDHAALLERRVQAAARNVCERPFIRDLKAMSAYEECLVDVTADAQRQLAAAQKLPAGIEFAAR